ncbi:MAG: flagellar filament capping protein FliD [Pseudomonadota bacterium]|nr:flagellar filament capping protein FliD [Pseudomonadota bacterium]
MTTITSSTGTISSTGIGSGLDVNAIVTSLMAVESLPLHALQTKATTLQTNLSAFGQLQSLVSALQDAAKPMFDPNSFALTNSSSTDPTSVSAGTSTGAAPGIYAVSVSSLSSGQSLVSQAGQFTAGTSVVGTGSLTIRLGTWSGTGNSVFTPASTSADITVPIGATENTLAGIAAKINAANAGISASVVTDASGARLALQSSATGAGNGFRVVVADSDAGNSDAIGLSRLAYDPATNPAQMTLAQSASNTQASINGIAVSSSSNTLSGVIDNITFNLSKVTTQPVTVNVSRNTDAIKGRVAAFVAAYNNLNNYLATETHYDSTTQTAAPLQGDSTATSIQNQLHAMLSQSTGASTVFATLNSIGVQAQKGGALVLDDAALNNAVAKLPELTKALAHVDAAKPGNNGFGKRFTDWTGSLLSFGGALPGKKASIQSSLSANQKDQSALNDRLAQTKARLQAQYTALDKTMAKANALASFVTQQFYSKSSFNSNGSNNSN